MPSDAYQLVDSGHRYSEPFEGINGASRWDGRTLDYIPKPQLRIASSLKLHTDTATEFDPITFEVIRNALWTINEEHADTIHKASASPIIVFSHDLNSTIQTEIGEPVMFAPYVQYFAGVSDLVIQWTLENRSANPGIFDGDVFFQNDPLVGANHQMDVQTFAPVFVDGKLFCWTFNSLHVRDIGGMEPSSQCPTAQEIFAEATPIPPIKIMERGKLRQDVDDMLRRHSRLPDLMALDYRSQLAGIHSFRVRIVDLVERYGAATVKGVMRKLIDDASRTLSQRLHRLPDGTWRDLKFIAGCSTGDRKAHRIALTMKKTGDRLIFSNDGTEPQFGSVNSSFAAWRGAIACAIQQMLTWDHRFCMGAVLRHCEFRPVPGTMTCINRNGAVSTMHAPITTMGQGTRIVSKLLSCDPELKKMIMSGGVGGSSWTTMGGIDQYGQPVATVTLDEMAIGMGAFSFKDGVDQGGNYIIPKAEAGDCEVWEQAIPVLYLYRREFAGFGHGKYRGGAGLVLGWVGHGTKEQFVTGISTAGGLPCQDGLWGGHWGHQGFFFGKQDTGIRKAFAAKQLPGSTAELDQLTHLDRVMPRTVGVRLLENDVWVMNMNSGGGYGDPIKRDPALVLDDFHEGFVTPDLARRVYGVVLVDGAVDAAATIARRQEIRQERLARATPPEVSVRSQPDRDRSGVVNRFPIAEDLNVVTIGEQNFIACADCGYLLCDAASNYKLGSALINGSLVEIDDQLFSNPKDELDDEIVYHEYLCPNCGVLIENELTKADEEALWDVQLDASSLVPRKPGA